MAKRRAKFIFPPELVKEPIIYRMSKEYDVVPNIRRADITPEGGWVVLELEGRAEDIERALAAVAAQGVEVEAVEGDIVAG